MTTLAAGTRTTFVTPFAQYRDHNGKPCEVVRAIVDADEDHDQESLPMYVVKFDDGVQIEAWPEEVKA